MQTATIAEKPRKQAISGRFWAGRTYRGRIKDDHKIDPCMGSGHILVYAFDVLMQIYESAGYGLRDAARSILENNLYGLDIDDRAFQLAYFAVMMKARQYNRRILNGEYKPNVYFIQESNGINRNQLKYFGAGLNEYEKNKAITQMTALLDDFKDAKEYGSILTVDQYDWNLLERFVSHIVTIGQLSFEAVGLDDTAEKIKHLILQGKVLAQKYHVTTTNPPYMSSSSMSKQLDDLLRKQYVNSKGDLFAVFIERCLAFTKELGCLAMITQHAWMFLSSYEKLREGILENDIINMSHLGSRAFEEIGGEVVQTTSFVIRNKRLTKYKGVYARLIKPKSQTGKEELFLRKENQFIADQSDFFKIPNKPIAYWASKPAIKHFQGAKISDLFIARVGLMTTDNERFLRCFWEVCLSNICFDATTDSAARDSCRKWFPHNKGGAYRRWAGNRDYVVDWEENGKRIKETAIKKYPYLKGNPNFVVHDDGYYFRQNVSWSEIAMSNLAFRYYPNGYTFNVKGMSVFPIDNASLFELIAFCNSCVCSYFAKIINPSISFGVNSLANIPYISGGIEAEDIARENIELSTIDWDSFETSWDFVRHPLIKSRTRLRDAYADWCKECDKRFQKVKENEIRLNHLYINLYGLQENLDNTVEDRDISIRRAELKRDIRSLLSYAVGCMFGRYSLNMEGIVFAGSEWDSSKYVTFLPDEDNIIPITDEEYLEDDIVSRLCAWLKIVYGEQTLEENLDFIAKALGSKGDSSRAVIRNYFLNDFFKDHCQTFSVTGSGKRPIYWLFDSGKQNGFKALIYLHRYNADTIGNLRIDYLHRMQRIYESEIGRMQDMIDHSTNAREVAQATKRREKLTKQLKECREYDEKLAHLALSRIELDLDDGVKVNYRKIQTANDGKFYEVLADSKSIMAKK